jgi:hypothetical protein
MKTGPLLVPYAFVAMNWAAVASLYSFLRGSPQTGKKLWTTVTRADQRRPSSDHPLWHPAR